MKKTQFFILPLIVFLQFLFLVCQNTRGEGPTISRVRSEANPNNSLSYFILWNTVTEANARVEYGLSTDYGQSTPVYSTAGTDHKILLLGLQPQQRYHFRVLSGDAGGVSASVDYSFVTGELPEKFPTATVQVSDSVRYEQGVSFVFLYPFVTAIDMQGNFVWYYSMNEGFKLVNPVKKLGNGHLIMGIYTTNGDKSSIREIDMAGETVREFKTPHYHHDFLLLPDGHIAYIRASRREVDGNALVGDEVVEIDEAGVEVRTWSIFDFKKPERYCVPCSKRYFYGGWGDDWTHANNLIYVPSEDAYLLSIRHTDSIIKFARSSGDILWELGGWNSDFSFLNRDGFVHQHAPELLDNGNILLFDNGNHRQPEEFSRAAEYRIDQTKRTASLVWEYRMTGDEPFSSSYGDVDRLANGNTLIADFHNTLTEVTPEGRVVWQVALFQRRAKLHKVLRLPDLYFAESESVLE